jgi:predicted acetyltransferase/ribosomal protein S18 acetylase RimI-like enzyme
MEYRPALPEDAAVLARLNQQLIADEGHRNPMSVEELETRITGWLAGEYAATLFVDGGEICGYALYRREPDHVYLRQFFVSRDCRRRGIGRAAIHWLRCHAWGGAARIRVDVLIGNQAGIAFWRSVGFGDYSLAMETINEGGSGLDGGSMIDNKMQSLPPAFLVDDIIELRLIRIMGPADAATRSADHQFMAHVPEYRFAIHRRSDDLRVGRIHIRATSDEKVLRALGHSGYAVDESHRRNGYATRAIRLIIGLARHWNLLPLWILIEPDNIASRRAAERAGLTLADVVDSSPEAVAVGVGPKICRYQIME